MPRTASTRKVNASANKKSPRARKKKPLRKMAKGKFLTALPDGRFAMHDVAHAEVSLKKARRMASVGTLPWAEWQRVERKISKRFPHLKTTERGGESDG